MHRERQAGSFAGPLDLARDAHAPERLAALVHEHIFRGRDVQMMARPGDTAAMLDAGKCWGYIHAFQGLANLWYPTNPTPRTSVLNVCVPSGVSLTQLVRMFLQEARNNPAALHEDANLMVLNMLMHNFSCGQ